MRSQGLPEGRAQAKAQMVAGNMLIPDAPYQADVALRDCDNEVMQYQINKPQVDIDR